MSEADTLTPNPENPAPEPEILLEDDTPVDEDELEIGATKYKVAKPIKEAWNGLQKSTQTEKEAIRQDREAIARERAAFTESQKAFGALAKDYAQIEGVNSQLEQYKEFMDDPTKWAQVDLEDPNVRKHKALFDGLIQKRQNLIGQLNGKAAAAREAEQKAMTERQTTAERELAVKIPGWNAEKKAAFTKVGQELGFGEQELGPLMTDPRVIGALDEIAQFRAAKARAAAAKAAAAAARAGEAPEPEPAAKVKTNSSVTTSVPSDKDNGDDWLKKRQAQLKKAGKRF